MSERPGVWYEDGLCFTCTRCGNCCSGFSGTVSISDDEIAVLAARLELSVDEFRERYLRLLSDGSISLKEKPNYDCVFYAPGHGCLVYEDRPTQCRTWPFWRKNVATPTVWGDEARACPGMDKGRLYTLDEIEERAALTP